MKASEARARANNVDPAQRYRALKNFILFAIEVATGMGKFETDGELFGSDQQHANALIVDLEELGYEVEVSKDEKMTKLAVSWKEK